MKTFLHLGCGLKTIKSIDNIKVTNLDILELQGVDIIAPAFPLKIENNIFDIVYAAHLLEHYSKRMIPEVLLEWNRVLKKNGILRLSVPNFAIFAEIYMKHKRLDLMNPIIGGQTSFYDYHFSIFDEELLTDLMIKSGLTAIHLWKPERVFHGDVWDFSQAETMGYKISLNLEGRKK